LTDDRRGREGPIKGLLSLALAEALAAVRQFR
jgi:hypothetical protein